MADTAEQIVGQTPKKRGRGPLLIGAILAILGGGGGFFAVQKGLLGGSKSDHAEIVEALPPTPDVGFVPIDPLNITLGRDSGNKQLRFQAQLEVRQGQEADVTKLLPRIVDVMNSYLRAVETRDFEDPNILPRLRSQLLRRVQAVVGNGRVQDLLIMEFILN